MTHSNVSCVQLNFTEQHVNITPDALSVMPQLNRKVYSGTGKETSAQMHFSILIYIKFKITIESAIWIIITHQGLALQTLSWDKNWDSHSLVNGYPSFYPRIALVARSLGFKSTFVGTQGQFSIVTFWMVYQTLRDMSISTPWKRTGVHYVKFNKSWSLAQVYENFHVQITTHVTLNSIYISLG